MPQAYTSFTRTNADARVSYWPHPSGLCVAGVWQPATSYQNAPVLIVAHGGLGFNPGWRAMTSATLSSTKPLSLLTSLSALGWVIVSIDYPTCASNNDHNDGTTRFLCSWAEMHPNAMWPEQAAYLALAVQHVKTHWSAVSGETKTPFGTRLWGSGNSIDPSNVFVYGNSWGATMGLYAGLQPSGYYPFTTELGHETQDPFMPRASHRYRGIICVQPQIDLTQFHVQARGTYTSPMGAIYQDDILQPFMRPQSTRLWSTLPVTWKKQSPWWVLQEGHVENDNFSVFCEFTTASAGGTFSENLSADDWNPGTTLNDEAGGKAWIDPHDPFQGSPFREALLGYGSNESSAIRESVVRYSGGPTGQGVLGNAQYATQVKNWMANIGVDTEYLA